MCDLGEVLCEQRVSVALLQEPYIRSGYVCGLPMNMNVYINDGVVTKAAVVVNDPNLESMCVRECTNE